MERKGASKPEHTVIELGGIDKERLLRGENHRHHFCINSFSSREMDSLTAICDAFLPSIPVSDATTDPSVAALYRTSASMAGIPERIGGLTFGRLKDHPKQWLMRVTLWLLSTCIGTFICCGRASVCTKFPYFKSFPQLSLKKREEILLAWSLSYFYLLRMLFKTMKLLTLLIFFSQVDEKNENPMWKAIGYPGPDPDFKSQTTQYSKNSKQDGYSYKDHKQDRKELDDDDHQDAPLYKGIINLKYPREIVAENLRRFGFPVSVLRRKVNSPTSPSNPSLIIQCDAVVVGSGAGGGVVAGVLANAGCKVVVLEKGEYCARSNLTLLEGPSMDDMYLAGGMLGTNDMGMVILAGSTVGGGSTINWSASIQTPKHVTNEWCDVYDLELFDSKLYREAMDVVCKKMGVQSEIEEEGFNNAILRKGCEELGYPVQNIPRNSAPDHYCGWCCFGCKDRRKQGTAETWLVDVVNSGNGAILPGCEAIKILHKRKKGRERKIASGVAFEFDYKGVKDICIVESKVTIVACGAISTPPLLKKSGLKNSHIGKNLHLHPVTMAWGYFPDTTTSTAAALWPEREKKSYEGGILTAMSSVVGNFDTSGYGAVIQTPALHPGMFAGVMPWISGSDLKKRMRKFSRTAHIFALVRDKGSGIVNSPSSVSYQMEEIDEKNLKKGLEKVLRILAAAGAEEIGTHHFEGKTINVKKVSSHEFERFVKEESSRPLRELSTQLSSAHQMGSCRMGVNPKVSAVSQTGETWEVEGLYVADSSVFPTALGVNPMVTVQAIAYCTAQSVLQVLQRKKSRNRPI